MTFLLMVTLTSILLAAIMSAIAWRIAADERRRSEARVAALAADIHNGPPVTDPRMGRDDLELRPARVASTNTNDLFANARPRSGPRSAAVIGGGLFVFACALALAVLLSRGSASVAPPASTHAQPASAAAGGTAPQPQPLELVALAHEREGDRLIVRGVVRNPDPRADVQGLAAVVFLFNHDGGFLSSGRVMIDGSALRPGAETPFVVTIPGAEDVGRYRVSFRTDDHIVPHVDRRDHLRAQL